MQPTGVQKYTSIKSVQLKRHNVTTGAVSPNPFNSNFAIAYTTVQKEYLTIKIFNLNGQLIYTKRLLGKAENNTITVTETGKWPSGMYVVQLIGKTVIQYQLKR
ncbi:MAG: T9SS type A sorting domain-containing protein [Agriterribacter sp.]